MNMAEKKICDVCGKKINGINNIAYTIGDSTICSKCHEELGSFKVIKNYKTKEELNEAREQTLSRANELGVSKEVFDDLEKHFQTKEKIIIGKDQIYDYLMTTGSTLQGYHIDNYLGIVVGHVVIGGGIGSGFEASLADISGGEATMYRSKLDIAAEEAQNRAIKKAIMLGGNALVGVDVEYTTFAKDLMGVVFSGTCVVVHKETQD